MMDVVSKNSSKRCIGSKSKPCIEKASGKAVCSSNVRRQDCSMSSASVVAAARTSQRSGKQVATLCVASNVKPQKEYM